MHNLSLKCLFGHESCKQHLAALHMKKRCNMEMWENVRWLVFRYIGSLLSTCLAAVMFAFKYSQLVPKQLVTHVQYITHAPQQTWHPTGRAVYKNTAACIPKAAKRDNTRQSEQLPSLSSPAADIQRRLILHFLPGPTHVNFLKILQKKHYKLSVHKILGDFYT